MKPSVSVVTPAHNAGREILRALESVARQTFSALEHIVVDDASGDQTCELVKGFAAEYPVRLIRQTRRRGAAAARNLGIEAAQGRYIAFLDSDDEWLPEKLASQIGFMRDCNVAFSYGDYLRCQHDSRITSGAVLTPDCLSHQDFLKGCPIGCLTVAYDQQVLGKCYMPEVARGHDWGLWLALTRHGVIARRYPGVEAVYSVQPGSLSTRKFSKARDIYTIYRREEGLGRIRSAALLAIHSLNSFRRYRPPNQNRV